MPDLYAMIMEGQTPKDIIAAAIGTTKFDLETAAQQLSDEDCTAIENWTLLTLHVSGAQAMIVLGCLLSVYLPTCEREGRSDRFQRTLDTLGISKTKAYDAMAVFRVFGRVFLEEQKLMQRFPMESAKRLAAQSVPAPARDAAIELARKGEDVSIKRAAELIKTHSPQGDNRKGDVSHGKSRGSAKPNRRWSFAGKFVCLTIDAAKVSTQVKVEAIVHDFEAALQSFLKEYGLHQRGTS